MSAVNRKATYAAPVAELHSPRAYGRDLVVGTGRAPAHHGELLQGVFEDSDGRLQRGLVTLPFPGRASRARFQPSDHHWGIVGTPELTKVRRAAILALRRFSGYPVPVKGGQIEIVSDVPRGIGMGSSTSDVTATIRAVADFYGIRLSHEEVGRLAVLAECASDSIMIDDRVVLFAHRVGVVLETFGPRLPPIVVVGCDAQPGVRVDTLELIPARYDERELAAFVVMRAGLRRAVGLADPDLLGRVATASARLNQRFLPKPVLEDLIALNRRLGGCGVQIAHSGTVAGLIFDARRPGIADTVPECVAALEELGLPVTGTIEAAADDPTLVGDR
jgi:uncharacterized protein involved in propanediol utilization